MDKSKAGAEAEIRALIDARIKAIRAKDVEGATAPLAPDIRWFDVVNPLRHAGADTVRQRATAWFGSFEGPVGCELRELSVAAGGDLGFSHQLIRYSGTRTSGETMAMWVRVTACYRRIDGKWMIVHEHASVPFDMETGKASLDIQP